MDFTILVFLDAAGKPTDVAIGDIPNHDETMLDIAQEGIDRLAEREPILAMLTTRVVVIGHSAMRQTLRSIPSVESLGDTFNVTKRVGYLAWAVD